MVQYINVGRWVHDMRCDDRGEQRRQVSGGFWGERGSLADQVAESLADQTVPAAHASAFRAGSFPSASFPHAPCTRDRACARPRAHDLLCFRAAGCTDHRPMHPSSSTISSMEGFITPMNSCALVARCTTTNGGHARVISVESPAPRTAVYIDPQLSSGVRHLVEAYSSLEYLWVVSGASTT
jgi:hypothetical protein